MINILKDSLQLSNSALKYLGCLFMLIDHATMIFVPPTSTFYYIGRGIGRLAAPIFFWAISEGGHYTKHMGRYLRNLIVLGILFQFVFMIVEGQSLSLENIVFGFKNIFFTLFLGLAAIAIIKKVYHNASFNYIKWGALILMPVLGAFMDVDYGAYGVLMILCFYLFRNSKLQITLSIIALNGIFYALGDINWLQLLSMLALLLIFIYNGERGKGNKYFFYVFYPLHLVILYGIKSLMMLL